MYSLREHVLCPADRQGRDRLDRETTREPAAVVGLVELLRRDLRRRRLVHPQELGKSARDLRRTLHHHVAADEVGRVAEAVRVPAAGRVEQKPRRLDRVAADRDGRRSLEPLHAVPDVGHAGCVPGRVVDLHARDERVCPDLAPVLDRVREVRDERRRLRVHLAALEAEAAVDAVRPVPEPAVRDRHRPDAHLDPLLARSLPREQRRARNGVRAVRVPVRVSPGPELAGNRQLALDTLERRLELVVGDRPIDRDAVARPHLEVRRMQTRHVAGEVRHRPSDPDT
jgi:hypothetical protein